MQLHAGSLAHVLQQIFSQKIEQNRPYRAQRLGDICAHSLLL